MNTQTSMHLALHEQRLRIADLCEKFWASANDIGDQLANYRVPLCRKFETTEIASLETFLRLPSDRFLDELASPLYPIFTSAMLSRILSVPLDVLLNPTFQQRLPEPILVGTSKMYRGAEIEFLLLLDSSKVSVRDFRRSRQLDNPQIAWLVNEQILPFPSLWGGAVPGWEVQQIESYESVPQISKLQARGGIPYADDGDLLTARDIAQYAKIAIADFVQCALEDEVGFCLVGEGFQWGWPRHYVDYEVASSPYLSSGTR